MIANQRAFIFSLSLLTAPWKTQTQPPMYPLVAASGELFSCVKMLSTASEGLVTSLVTTLVTALVASFMKLLVTLPTLLLKDGCDAHDDCQRRDDKDKPNNFIRLTINLSFTTSLRPYLRRSYRRCCCKSSYQPCTLHQRSFS